MSFLAILTGSFLGNLLDPIIIVTIGIAFLLPANLVMSIVAAFLGVVAHTVILLALGTQSKVLAIPAMVLGGFLANWFVASVVMFFRSRRHLTAEEKARKGLL